MNFKNYLRLDSVYFRYAVRLALACGIAQFFVGTFEIKDGYWVILTIIVCTMHTLGKTLKRSLQRILGTLAGALLGVIIVNFLGKDLFPLEILLPVFLFLAYYLRSYDYGVAAIFLTPAVLLFINLIDPSDTTVSWLRLSTTMAGGLIAVIFSYFLLPSYTEKMVDKKFLDQYTLFKCFLSNFLTSLATKSLQPKDKFTNHYIDVRDELYLVIKELEIEYFYNKSKIKVYRDAYYILSSLMQSFELLGSILSSLIQHLSEEKFIELKNILLSFNKLTIVNVKNGKFEVNEDFPSRLQELELEVAILREKVVEDRFLAYHDLSLKFATIGDMVGFNVALEQLEACIKEFKKIFYLSAKKLAG